MSIREQMEQLLESVADRDLYAQLDEVFGLTGAEEVMVHGKSPHRVAVKKLKGKYYAMGEDAHNLNPMFKARSLSAIKRWIKSEYG